MVVTAFSRVRSPNQISRGRVHNIFLRKYTHISMHQRMTLHAQDLPNEMVYLSN